METKGIINYQEGFNKAITADARMLLNKITYLQVIILGMMAVQAATLLILMSVIKNLN